MGIWESIVGLKDAPLTVISLITIVLIVIFFLRFITKQEERAQGRDESFFDVIKSINDESRLTRTVIERSIVESEQGRERHTQRVIERINQLEVRVLTKNE